VYRLYNFVALVPKVILCASEGVTPLNPMDVESFDSNYDEDEKNDKGANGGLGDEDAKGEEGDDGADKSYIDEDAAALSHGPTPVLPCTIRYMDLTCLKLQHFKRVPHVLLIRDEWDPVINIFNKRKIGTHGGALWTGQPGTGKRHYSPCICFNRALKARRHCCTTSSSFILSRRSRLSSRIFTINDEVRRQTGRAVTVPGNDVLALVDGSDKFYRSARRIRTTPNLQTLSKSSVRARHDRIWLTQIVKDLYAS